ncbi:MAG: type II secretion system protein GspK [Kiritimatiellia bacterium]|nr:type II secretion system protein GspK [Kiritimatiellia bacterium]
MKTISNVSGRSSPYPASGESGIILAVVLILLGVITALVLQAQVLAYSCLQLENRKLLRTQLRETAGDGVWRALDVLAADQNLLIDHTNEAWAAPMHIRLPNGIDTEIMIIDENRFVDANLLAFVSPSEQWRPSAAIVRDLLAGELFIHPELQTEIVRDWVDQNLEGSYETAYYRRLQKPVEPANSPMASREELLWLLAATTNTTARTTALTVLPAQDPRLEPVNVNTAGRQTLMAVFGDNNVGLIERIIRLRNVAPLLTLKQVMDQVTLQKFASYLSVKSSFFSVYSRSEMGIAAEAVYCLVKRDQTGNIQVIRWVEQ